MLNHEEEEEEDQNQLKMNVRGMVLYDLKKSAKVPVECCPPSPKSYEWHQMMTLERCPEPVAHDGSYDDFHIASCCYCPHPRNY